MPPIEITRDTTSGTASGFTLLEVVVAFSCAALILGAVLRVFSLGMRTADSAEMRTMGTMLAQSVMTEIQATGPLAPRAAFGSFENGFRWSYRIEPYELEVAPAADADASAVVVPYTISVTVGWGPEDDPAGTVTLTTLRVGGGEVDPGLELAPR